jgi:two-component system phosphate regulon response regulator PhoB
MNKSVLFVVDDEEVLRDLLVENLQDEGYEVYGFSNGKSALDQAKIRIESNLNLDLVLTDVNMPVMSGVALIAELRKLSYKNPIVLLSGEVGEDLVTLMNVPGVTAVESKPYNTKKLLENISQYLNSMKTSSLG